MQILDTIEKEKAGEINFDDHLMSNTAPKASEEHETDVCSSSDSGKFLKFLLRK